METSSSSSPSKKRQGHRYGQELQSMLYTFGDVRSPLPETVSLLEDLLHTELRVLVHKSAQVALGRHHRTANLSPEDVCFTVRGEEDLMDKLRDFLAWREVRKNVKGNGNEGEVVSVEADEKAQKRPMRFPWDQSAAVLDLVPREVLAYYEDFPVSPLTRSLDQLDHSTASGRDLDRRFFDAVTQNMSSQDYLEYSECRQASFTFKKLKKFREWLQPGQVTDYRLTDDCLELLGFVAWELAQRLAMRALELQAKAKIERRTESTGTIGNKRGPFSSKPKPVDGKAQNALLPSFLRESYRHYQALQSKQSYFQRFFV